MDTGLQTHLGIQILAGTGLAAAAGLRAFLPPLLLGVLARLDLLELRPSLEWLASTPALVILATAVTVEILADKIPLLDHGLDLLQSFMKPVAGCLVLAGSLHDLAPLPAAVIALLLGGGVSGSVHLAKSGLRLASTGTTSGIGNPFLSLGEDILSLGGSLLAVFAPLLLLALLLLVLLLLRRIVGWMRSRAQTHPQAFFP
ncbi:MAG: DUF4126 domain-containing protein [Acidobacteriota bacterium]